MKLKEELILERGEKCEICGITEWLGKKINLQIHHKDFNHYNNDKNNLQLVCPNCHSYTENYSKNIKNNSVSEEELVDVLKKSKTIHQAFVSLNMSTSSQNYARARKLIQKYKIISLYQKEKEQNYCLDCGAPICEKATRCRECQNIFNRKIKERPNREDLKNLIRKTSFVKIGEMYNVSDNAVRKWCVSYNLPKKSSDIKKITDEEWENI